MDNPFVEALLRASAGDLARLRRAYRSLSLRLHPDSSGRKGEEFLLVQEAYAEAKRLILEEVAAETTPEPTPERAPRAQSGAEAEGTAFRAPGFPEARPTDLGGRPVAARRSRAPSEEERAALYYGVAYWKYRSPESRLAFRLGELEAWLAEAPLDPFEWPPGFRSIIKGKSEAKPWAIHLKRQRQVVPLLGEDEGLYKECKRFEDYIGQNLGWHSFDREEGTGEIAALFLAAMRAGFVALGASGNAAPRAGEGAFFSRLEELAASHVDFQGPHAFKAACLRLVSALGPVLGAGWNFSGGILSGGGPAGASRESPRP
jgi:hypothetical protein